MTLYIIIVFYGDIWTALDLYKILSDLLFTYRTKIHLHQFRVIIKTHNYVNNN